MQKVRVAKPLQWLRKNVWARAAVSVLVVVLIFGLGVGVGEGRIMFGSHSLNRGLPDTLNYASVNQVYQVLKNNYDGTLTTTQLLNGLKQGLAQATADPYTEYFTPQEAQDFNSQLNNSFSGIGAELGADSSGDVEIIAPIAGMPAAKAGLQPKDIIATINGVSTSGMSPDEAVTKIRGKAGTRVTLGIIRGQQQLDIVITRANITVPSVTTKVLPGNIGYMQISTFADDTADLAAKAAQQFANDHVKGVILDLRNNPGGLVDAAQSVSSLWLPDGTTIMQEKRGSQVVQTYSATGNNVLHGIPTVVLVNDGSASASEITAGALHDNKAAQIIGMQTYGKGVVQALENLPGGAQLKVTVASWYRPDGQNINHKGITPDEVVQITAAEVKTGQDPQQQAAIDWLQKQ